MSTDWQFPGSRWWKCDLHLHTPDSDDFEDRKTVTPERWVSAAVGQGLEVVAVTDHNSGRLISAVVEAAEPQGLHVFPGVEITVSGGAHLLTLFDKGRDGQAVTALLGRCGIPDQDMGTKEACASCSFVDALDHGVRFQGLNIAAHVDGRNGFLQLFQPGRTAQTIIQSESLHAVEVTGDDLPLLQYLDNTRTGYERPLGPLPQLTFSDAHALNQIGRRYTWIKMTRPSLEGLRLALEDGSLSVRPCTEAAKDPNTHAAFIIESVEIGNARYTGLGEPLKTKFNPWLNAVIGGRGTGKSSLVEFLRIALRREEELPESLQADFRTLKKIAQSRQDRGLLREGTWIRVCYLKDGSRFRIQWDVGGTLPSIEVEEPDGSWQTGAGYVADRFPVRIYSQKQIFEMTREPGSLLRIVDDSSQVDRRSWQERWLQEESRFLALRAKIREVEARLADQDRIEGALQDVVRKLTVFEVAGHSEVLRNFQRRRRQERSLDSWEEGFRQTAEQLGAAIAGVAPPAFDGDVFDPADEADRYLLEAAETAATRIQEIGHELETTAGRLRSILDEWQLGREQWKETETVRRDLDGYESLLERLRGVGAGDPGEYGSLIQARQTLEQRLADLAAQRKNLADLEEQSRQSLQRLHDLRRELTWRRARFLEEVVGKNPHVRIEAIPYGDEGRAEAELQSLLQTRHFQNDFRSLEGEGLLPRLYQTYVADSEKVLSRDPALAASSERELEQRLQYLKDELAKLGRSQQSSLTLQDQRFAKHLSSLKPEIFDRLALWFPEDSLRVTYSRQGGGGDFVPLDQGSPGQKAAAILAFLLSYGEEPMILDQPEDDLDNHLISDLLVRQIRENKARRQFIVVTHNPNIVVNADAELVLVLDFRGGQTRVTQSGGLQEQDVRDEVCRVMEGGREALVRRYRRIGRSSRNV